MRYKKKYSIFISSTYEDLTEERRAILGVALENDYIPVGMEQFHAYPASQWDVIKKMIDECDAYLVIIAGRYGSIDETTGISFTEKEYNYAKEKGLPVLVLIRKPDAITSDKLDDGDDMHMKRERLVLFQKKVESEGNTCDYFGSISDLKYRVANALKNTTVFCGDDAGWVRYSDIEQIVNDSVTEQNKGNIAYAERLNDRIKSMEETLIHFTEELGAVRKDQLTWHEIEPVSKQDINNMFRDGDNLRCQDD